MGKGGVRQWLQKFSAIGRALKWNEGVQDTTLKALTVTKEKPIALMNLKMAPSRPGNIKIEVKAKESNPGIKGNVNLNVHTPSEDFPASQTRQPYMARDKGRRGNPLKQLNNKKY